MNGSFIKSHRWWLFTLLVGLIALRLIFPDNSELSQKMPTASEEETVVATSVRVEKVQAVERMERVALNGFSEPLRQSQLKVQASGDIDYIGVEQGDQVESGALILALKNDDLSQGVQSAKLAMKKARSDYESIKALKKQGLASNSELLQRQADYDQSVSNYLAALKEQRGSLVQAPFEGVVEQFDWQVGDRLEPGAVIGTLSDLSRVRLRLNVPQQYIHQLSVGDSASIESPALSLEGKVNYVARVADSQTRTFSVEVISEPHDALTAGGMALVSLDLDQVSAYQVPNSALVLNEQGDLSLKVVDTKGVVDSIAVRLIEPASEGVWVAAREGRLPQQARVVVVGQMLVSDGESVDYEVVNISDRQDGGE